MDTGDRERGTPKGMRPPVTVRRASGAGNVIVPVLLIACGLLGLAVITQIALGAPVHGVDPGAARARPVPSRSAAQGLEAPSRAEGAGEAPGRGTRR